MGVFIDSNIPMYVADAAHPNREPAMRFMERVRAGEIDACTSTEVLQEILCRYSALG
jgi:predicted nucleic acid-binding protein